MHIVNYSVLSIFTSSVSFHFWSEFSPGQKSDVIIITLILEPIFILYNNMCWPCFMEID